MADFINSFIEAGKGGDYRKLDDLTVGLIYKVIQFNMKNTQYGNALEGEIEDPVTLEPFNCFFPERLAKKVKCEEDLRKLNEHHFSFIFKGRENKAAILEFFTK